MRYTVEVGGEQVEVEVRGHGGGLELSVAGGPFRPARLAPCPAPLHSLELGDQRRSVVLDEDPLEPAAVLVRLPDAPPVRALAVDARALAAAEGRQARAASGPALQRSPMPGVIVEVRVEPGAEVSKGDVLLILEAMKMQNELQAERDGVISDVHVRAGDAVAGGAKLVEFEAEVAE